MKWTSSWSRLVLALSGLAGIWRRNHRLRAQARLNASRTEAPGRDGSLRSDYRYGVTMVTSLDSETYDALIGRSGESGDTLAEVGGRETPGTETVMMMMHDEPSAAKTLDAIRDGGGNLLLMLRQRINETTKALDEGGFIDAAQRLHEAQGICTALAQAQQHLGVAQTGRIIRAGDLEAGMTLTNIGEVTEIDQATCEHENCPGHFLVTIGDNAPLMLDANDMLYVEVAG